ncbi:class A beta-lactamase [Rickettsiales bacterium LUAb2]
MCKYFIYSIALIIIILPVKNYSEGNFYKQLSNLEHQFGGQIGVYALNTNNNNELEFNADQNFPFLSTYKIIVAAAILKQSMINPKLLNERLYYTEKDVKDSGYAPVTKKHIKDGMTISELCAAAVSYSDNTASNLLVKKLGGIGVINKFALSINNKNFRLDRIEPNLNTSIPGDIRDTSTPKAMAKSLYVLLISDKVLGNKQKIQLENWLKNTVTGADRIRSGIPADWVVGDKTGTGSYGTTADIGIVWPNEQKSLIIAIYYTQDKKDAKANSKVIAEVTKLIIQNFKYK